MLPKAHLTAYSRMSGSRWVTTPSWLSGALRSFFNTSSVYSCHLFLISSASFQLLSHVRLFATPWTAAHQASLSITNSRSFLKLMSIELVMPSNHLILCCPLFLLPSIFLSLRVFSNESAFHIRWPNYGASASASVLPVNIQDWFPLGLTGLISLKSFKS